MHHKLIVTAAHPAARVRCVGGEHQDHPRAACILRSDFEAAHAALQFSSFIGRQRQRNMARQSTITALVSTSH